MARSISSVRPVLAASVLLAGCGRDPEPVRVVRARPVTVITLERSAPDVGGRIMGVAEPYRSEDIGFEVGGRLTFVTDLGREVAGPSLDDEDNVIPGAEGARIAALDATRYRQAFRAAELQLASAQKALAAQRIQAEMAATSDLEQAKAGARIAAQEEIAARSAHELARTRYERTAELLQQGGAAQSTLDSDRNLLDSASAAWEAAKQGVLSADNALASARAEAALAQARVEQGLAQIAELEQRVTQAGQDLADCVLRAPFSGRITELQLGRGGYVQPGAPVVTLTAMDPMQVSITVSAERSRALFQGSQVALFPRDLRRFTDLDVIYGGVYAKAEIADAATRTYRIDIVVRNMRRTRASRATGGSPVPAVDGVMPVLREQPGSRGPLFVGADCIAVDGERQWVFRLPGLQAFLHRQQPPADVLHPEQVPVTRGAERLTFVNFKFVAIADGSGLREDDVLIRNPAPAYPEGVSLERIDWLIRPGDLVPVAIDLQPAPAGLYVPVEAISTSDGESRVFVVDRGRCRAVAVTVHESAGGLRRIEGAGLVEGSIIVHEGVHYLADGEAVEVVASVF